MENKKPDLISRNTNKLKSIDYNKHFGYIIYLLVVNYFVLGGFIAYSKIPLFDKITDMHIDGADFSFFFNFFGFIINIILFLSVCAVGVAILIIISLIFNRYYFETCKLSEKQELLSDIRSLIMISTLVALLVLVVFARSYLLIPMMLIYLMFPFFTYIFTDNRLNKLTRGDNKRQRRKKDKKKLIDPQPNMSPQETKDENSEEDQKH